MKIFARLRQTDQMGQTPYLFQVSDCACTTAPERDFIGTAVYTGLQMHNAGVMQALWALTCADRMERVKPHSGRLTVRGDKSFLESAGKRN